MSDTFQNIAKRAESERQVIRRSQFSKEIFWCRRKPELTVNINSAGKEMIIVCQ